jgi:hypothetical protein
MTYDPTFGFPHIHSDVAWSHFLAQHLGKVNTENFVRAFYPPLDLLDTAQSDLLTKRWIETAEGIQLDGIGSIVGISREISEIVFLPFFGFTAQPAGKGFNQARIRHDREPYAGSRFMGDIEYQAAILDKIALNNGHGTAEDIIRHIDFVLGTTGSTVFDMSNATASLLINDMTITTADPRYSLINKHIANAAGVKIWPTLVAKDTTFGFQNQAIYFGFNVGVLARSPDSNIGPISLEV